MVFIENLKLVNVQDLSIESMYSNKSLITSQLCPFGGVIFGNYNGFQTIVVMPMIIIT